MPLCNQCECKACTSLRLIIEKALEITRLLHDAMQRDGANKKLVREARSVAFDICEVTDSLFRYWDEAKHPEEEESVSPSIVGRESLK